MRFGDYLNSIPLPAILSVIKAEEWENYRAAHRRLRAHLFDDRRAARRPPRRRQYPRRGPALHHHRDGAGPADDRGDPRGHAPRLRAGDQVNFKLERLETNPRFAAISRPANAAILIELRIEMDDRGGKIEILLPYATIEPIREQLLQMYMGEKFGRDPIWEGHLATEIYRCRRRGRSGAARAGSAAQPRAGDAAGRHGDVRPLAARSDQAALRRCRADRGDHGSYRQPRFGARVAPAQPAQGNDGGLRSNRRATGGQVMFGLPLGLSSKAPSQFCLRRQSVIAWS